MNAKESIMNGKAALGIEFGSTRIKAVLVDENCETLAVRRLSLGEPVS